MEFCDVEEFLSYLDPADTKWGEYYFRGVSSSKHLLIPSIWRKDENVQSLYKNFMAKFEQNGLNEVIINLVRTWKVKHQLSEAECSKYQESFYKHYLFWNFEQYLLSKFYTITNLAGFSVDRPDLQACFTNAPDDFINKVLELTVW